jgi:hypothetical protein
MHLQAERVYMYLIHMIIVLYFTLCFSMHTTCIKTEHDPFFSTINVLPTLTQTVGELVKNLGNSIHLDSRSNSNLALFLFHFHPSLPEPTKETICRRQQRYGMDMFPDINDSNSNYHKSNDSKCK